MRKLKCSGTNPCERCSRRNQRCCFSEIVAIDVPRRPSRGTNECISMPTSLTSPRLVTNDNSQTVEARLERLEKSMEIVVSQLPGNQERFSVEPAQVNVDTRDFQGDTSFQAPIEEFNANLAPVKLQLGISNQRSSSSPKSSDEMRNASATSPSGSTSDPLSSIRVGRSNMPFPNQTEYATYIEFFFDDINPCHPCTNEADFRRRSERLLASSSVDPSEVCFLALNYIVFACADVLLGVSTTTKHSTPPGWHWFLAANDLVGKRKVSGQGDLSLIQFLVYEAFYLVHTDMPNAAYNVAGLACRATFQFGLHQQSYWGTNCSPYTAHMRQRLFWTVYFLDRRISLSCGRPYGIRDSDIDLDEPEWMNDKVLPDQPLPLPCHDSSFNMYLSCMIIFAKFAGEIWDQVFSARASKISNNGETLAMLDARIKHWSDTVLPNIPLLPKNKTTTKRHLRQQLLVHTRISHLRLLLRRRMMISLKYDANTGQLCGDLAIEVIHQIKAHSLEVKQPSSFRFHMATSLGSAVLILATLLGRQLSDIGLQDKISEYTENFRDGVSMLHDLAAYLQAARRIADDLEDIIQVILSIINQQPITPQIDSLAFAPTDIDSLFPYGAIDFAQQAGFPGQFDSNPDFEPGLFSGDVEHAFDPWVGGLQPPDNCYGVPWI
ncbi:fungal-specific transcription factor domain-containing protein [Xylogone sp. PMI_703]|nr:fungal-specific transcription factor domain-containing protein [Xylogone sp. PMI_703]